MGRFQVSVTETPDEPQRRFAANRRRVAVLPALVVETAPRDAIVQCLRSAPAGTILHVVILKVAP
jgi:hypothetical protein